MRQHTRDRIRAHRRAARLEFDAAKRWLPMNKSKAQQHARSATDLAGLMEHRSVLVSRAGKYQTRSISSAGHGPRGDETQLARRWNPGGPGCLRGQIP